MSYPELKVRLTPVANQMDAISKKLEESISSGTDGGLDKFFSGVTSGLSKQIQTFKFSDAVTGMFGGAKNIPTEEQAEAMETPKGMLGAMGNIVGRLAVLTVVGTVVAKGVESLVKVAAQASPMLGAMLSLSQKTFMLGIKPIGDIMALAVKPTLLMLLKNVILPFDKYMAGLTKEYIQDQKAFENAMALMSGKTPTASQQKAAEKETISWLKYLMEDFGAEYVDTALMGMSQEQVDYYKTKLGLSTNATTIGTVNINVDQLASISDIEKLKAQLLNSSFGSQGLTR